MTQAPAQAPVHLDVAMVKIDQNLAQVSGAVPDGRTPKMEAATAVPAMRTSTTKGPNAPEPRFLSGQKLSASGPDRRELYCGQLQLGSSRSDLVGARVAATSLAEPRFDSCRVQHLRSPCPRLQNDFEARTVLSLGMRFLSPAVLVKPAAKWLSECGRTQGPRPLIP